MYLNEIMLSSKFLGSLPEGRREYTLRKLKYFFAVYAGSDSRGIHTGARPMEIRGVPGVYKLRTSRGERVLYEVDRDNNIILRVYAAHDNQISRAKHMGKNEAGEAPFASLFDMPTEEGEFNQYEVEPASELLLLMDQAEILIATDEWIAQCEGTADYIWLASAEQADIIGSSRYPQFISGSAGTGKTTVLFQKLCGLAQNKGNILYITMSRTLKEDFQGLYEKFKPKQEAAQITFLTMDELNASLLPGHPKIAAQEQFLAAFSPACQKENVNPQDAWCEIEGIVKSHLGITDQTTISFLDQLVNSASTTLSHENYSDVKPKYSYFPLESRDKIYEIAVLYDMWLAEQGLADINQLAAKILRSGAKQQYDLIIIDEVQDFTELQLYMLMQLANAPTRMIFCGDINQNVRPTFFMFERLYNIYYSLGCKSAKENMYTLTKNYRSCTEIVLLLNRILDEQGRRIGFQGSSAMSGAEDEGIHETGFRDGYVPLVMESTGENLKHILGAIFDKHYAIAITPDEQTRDALSSILPKAKGRIFTVQEAKGLEYDVVFTVNVTSAYEKEWRKILYEKNVKRQRRLRRFFGYIYVAASRARNHLVIAEKDDCSFLDMVSGTYSVLDEWDLVKVGLAAQSTADDFDRDARKLEKAGLADKAQAAREMAEKLREKEEPRPEILPAIEEATSSLYKPLGQLTKKLTLVEQENQQGVINEQGDIVIPCEFESIAHSVYKDESGKAVLECRRDSGLVYYDQNGNVFKPRAAKSRKHKDAKKSGKRIIALAAVFLSTVAGVSMFAAINHFLLKPPVEPDMTADFVPHEPIADVIEGNIIQVAAGKTHSAALMEDGTIWTWGDNHFEGGTTSFKEVEGDIVLMVTNEPDANNPAIKKVDIDNIVYVAAGNYITAAIKEDGTLWTWGYNAFGALGNGIDFAVRGKEYVVDSKPYNILDDVKSVSLGDSWGMAVKNDGSLWVWGLNRYGILANETIGGHSCEPVKIMDNVAEASAGAWHGMALQKDGKVWVWGDNYYGQVGTADPPKEFAVKPQRILSDASHIFAGFAHSSAIKRDGTAMVWGAPTDGVPTSLDRYPFGDARTIIEMGGGSRQLLLLASDGALYSKADKDDKLSDLTDSVAQMSMYDNHLLILKKDGSVWASGKNEYCQLGDGTVEARDNLVLIYSNK